jgi:hypothetical protein
MRIDRSALIRGLAVAANRERERRLANEQAEAEAGWREILDKIAAMAERFVAVPRPCHRELAEQFVAAADWVRVDELRLPADLSRAEAVALCWTVDPAAAVRLLGSVLSQQADSGAC